MRRVLLLTLCLVGCGDARTRHGPPITVHAAASLARPLAVLADSFLASTGVPVQTQLGGSMELARRTTDLGMPPDVLLLADDEVVVAMMPAHIDWYVRFATSRLVVAHAPGSPWADSISTDNWWRVLSRDGVSIGRADTAMAPAGRHALAVLRRAEGYYRESGLTARLLARAGPRHVRPNAAELAALLEAGEVDFILDYESVAEQYGFGYVRLPTDLAPAVLYGAAVPKASARAADATRFVAWLLGDTGRRILRSAEMDVLRVPVAIGRNIPPEIVEHTRTMAERP